MEERWSIRALRAISGLSAKTKRMASLTVLAAALAVPALAWTDGCFSPGNDCSGYVDVGSCAPCGMGTASYECYCPSGHTQGFQTLCSGDAPSGVNCE